MGQQRRTRANESQPRGNGYSISRNLNPTLVSVEKCRLLGHEVRKHSPQQLRKLAASLERFGFVLPILIDAKHRVVAGWGLLLAARKLGLSEIPAVCVTDLPESELRLLRLALNRITDDASWDRETLALEFAEILELAPQIELQTSGFETAEIDIVLYGNGIDEEDDLPPIDAAVPPLSGMGDLWRLGDHRLYCGDALDTEAYARVLGTDKASMMFTDPPYNVPIAGFASGLGAFKHADFAMAKGEMSPQEYEAFLAAALGQAARHSHDGAIHYICIDWRHLSELLAAGRKIYGGNLLNVCVWNKSNGGMGSFYRSKHELIPVYKVGKGPHINNIALGRHGRNRPNVWDYVSQNSLNGSAKSKLALHPTVKPVAMIADAIRDCSNRGDRVLDPFGGAGTTLIAAERTGRRACVIELEPKFVDVAIERWQRLTGGTAVHAQTGKPFTRPGDLASRDNEE